MRPRPPRPDEGGRRGVRLEGGPAAEVQVPGRREKMEWDENRVRNLIEFQAFG